LQAVCLHVPNREIFLYYDWTSPGTIGRATRKLEMCIISFVLNSPLGIKMLQKANTKGSFSLCVWINYIGIPSFSHLPADILRRNISLKITVQKSDQHSRQELARDSL
jgi:hypothetical protein